MYFYLSSRVFELVLIWATTADPTAATPVSTPADTRNMTSSKPSKPTPDFPLYPHGNKQWAAKVNGERRYFGHWDDPLGALAKYNAAKAAKVTPSRRAAKRSKFPLFPHSSGQWAKKVNGKTHYFGKDREEALRQWNAEKDSIERGEVRTAELTVKEMCNQFLFAQQQRKAIGELGERTWDDYRRLCKWIAKVLGDDTAVASLRPVDFGRLRAAFATGEGRPLPEKPRKSRAKKKACSPVTLFGLIQHAKVVFNWAEENLLDKRIKYGSQFDKPSQSTLRKARNERGELMFDREEVKAMLAVAKPQMKAMVWLGINCALGNADCAGLTLDDLDLDGGWLSYPRGKTGIDRRCPLWPETVEAIGAALKSRPDHKDNADARKVFITKYGFNWGPKTLTGDCPIAKETAKMLRKLGIARPRLGFYSLRRTFVTVAGEQVDREAIRCIGGWVKGANDMLARYEQRRPNDERLKTVSDHVRKWLTTPDSQEQTADGGEQSLPAA